MVITISVHHVEMGTLKIVKYLFVNSSTDSNDEHSTFNKIKVFIYMVKTTDFTNN